VNVIARRLAHGSCFGYVAASTADRFEYYLSGHCEKAAVVASWLRRTCDRVGLLVEIQIDETARGQGHGAALLGGFLVEARSLRADAILLLADKGQPQSTGFDLERWYRKAGFAAAVQTPAGPIMIYPVEKATALSSHLTSVSRT
jgi:GNAT superfamily N-acetyltransferase